MNRVLMRNCSRIGRYCPGADAAFTPANVENSAKRGARASNR